MWKISNAKQSPPLQALASNYVDSSITDERPQNHRSQEALYNSCNTDSLEYFKDEEFCSYKLDENPSLLRKKNAYLREGTLASISNWNYIESATSDNVTLERPLSKNQEIEQSCQNYYYNKKDLNFNPNYQQSYNQSQTWLGAEAKSSCPTAISTFDTYNLSNIRGAEKSRASVASSYNNAVSCGYSDNSFQCDNNAPQYSCSNYHSKQNSFQSNVGASSQNKLLPQQQNNELVALCNSNSDGQYYSYQDTGNLNCAQPTSSIQFSNSCSKADSKNMNFACVPADTLNNYSEITARTSQPSDVSDKCLPLQQGMPYPSVYPIQTVSGSVQMQQFPVYNLASGTPLQQCRDLGSNRNIVQNNSDNPGIKLHIHTITHCEVECQAPTAPFGQAGPPYLVNRVPVPALYAPPNDGQFNQNSTIVNEIEQNVAPGVNCYSVPWSSSADTSNILEPTENCNDTIQGSDSNSHEQNQNNKSEEKKNEKLSEAEESAKTDFFENNPKVQNNLVYQTRKQNDNLGQIMPLSTGYVSNLPTDSPHLLVHQQRQTSIVIGYPMTNGQSNSGNTAYNTSNVNPISQQFIVPSNPIQQVVHIQPDTYSREQFQEGVQNAPVSFSNQQSSLTTAQEAGRDQQQGGSAVYSVPSMTDNCSNGPNAYLHSETNNSNYASPSQAIIMNSHNALFMHSQSLKFVDVRKNENRVWNDSGKENANQALGPNAVNASPRNSLPQQPHLASSNQKMSDPMSVRTAYTPVLGFSHHAFPCLPPTPPWLTSKQAFTNFSTKTARLCSPSFQFDNQHVKRFTEQKQFNEIDKNNEIAIKEELSNQSWLPVNQRSKESARQDVILSQRKQRGNRNTSNKQVENKKFSCTERDCSKRFLKEKELRVHINKHHLHMTKPYFCNYCNKSFKRPDQLKRHEKIHTGEKPHQCEICGRSFARTDHRNTHYKKHSSIEKEGVNFSKNSELFDHKTKSNLPPPGSAKQNIPDSTAFQPSRGFNGELLMGNEAITSPTKLDHLCPVQPVWSSSYVFPSAPLYDSSCIQSYANVHFQG